MTEGSEFKSGYVALVGRPNVGKSTLVNTLLDFDLSIITPKAQTTRHKILGILSSESFQFIFWDTPGILKPEYKLHELMLKSAQSAMRDSDIVLWIVDGTDTDHKADLHVLPLIKQIVNPVILVINKTDAMTEPQIEDAREYFGSLDNFAAIIPASALKRQGIEDIKSALVRFSPQGMPFYPLDQITEHPERFFVSEIIRERIFVHFSQEIPYSTAVVIDEFHEQPERKDLIKARIIVEKSSQKPIIIGKGGSALKKIGQESRERIEEFLGRPVFLELWVAVREKWRNKEVFLKEFGYDDRSR
ncbi:GTPase Era [candidate division KSB1 bacterium]|jgi:GTP-binding protein Era|nr:GTPase Era [candidate division KSB1 bacterium]